MTQLAVVDVDTGEILDNEASAIGGLFRKAHATHVDSVRYLFQCGERLREKKTTLSHGGWLPWLEANREILGFGERTAQLLIKGANSNPQLASDSQNPKLTADLPPAECLKINRKIWGNHNHRAQGTGENEWYTPAIYLDAARAALDGIDLDPASSECAQETVAAAEFFSEEDDGLQREWNGRVWLNPPYSQPLIQQFIEKLCVEYSSGRVTAAILLTHNYTDTEWFHIAARTCDAICFTRGRVKFVNPQGEEAAPTQGQAFTYFGRDRKSFIEHFSSFGVVLIKP
jgi:ParB family chromosome partitioning protein